MGTSRVFIGRLPDEATKGDLEHFFRHYGRVKDVSLKVGYAFVDLESSRDAEEAVYDLNNKHLCGYRVNVEMSKSRAPSGGFNSDGAYSRGETYSNFRNDRFGRRGRDFGARDRGYRHGAPEKTRYRMIVENLTTRYSWQDLKDLMRQSAEVTFADAHRFEKNKALVCFASHRDLKRAMDKFQGKEINGRALKLIDDTQDDRSPSRSPIRRSSRSSHSGSVSDGSDGRPRCPRSVSRSRSRSGSISPKKSRTKRSRSRSRSGSASPPKKSSTKQLRSYSRSVSSSSRGVKNDEKHPRVVYDNAKVDRSRSSSRSRSRSSGRNQRK